MTCDLSLEECKQKQVTVKQKKGEKRSQRGEVQVISISRRVSVKLQSLHRL